jgi:drug/metabolite transporter (DMT)-like permease
VIAARAPRRDDVLVSDRLLLPVFVLLWSSGYVIGALAIQVSGPIPLLAIRFALASLVTVPLALRQGRWRGGPLRRLAAIGLLLQVTQFGGIYAGLSLGVPAGLSALVMLGLSPLVTTGLSIAARQERSDPRVWIGLSIGVAGVAIGLAPELGRAQIGAGLAFTLLGMFGLAGGTVLQKRWSADVDPLVSAAAQSVTAAAVMAPVAAIAGGRLDVGPQLVLTLGWLGWGMGIVLVLVLVSLLRRLDASHVGALLLLVPAVTAIASAPVLGQALHPVSLVGMAVAMAGVRTVIVGGRGQAPRADDTMPSHAGAAAPPRSSTDLRGSCAAAVELRRPA